MILASCLVLIGASLSASPRDRTQLYNWKNVSIVAGGFITGITYHPKEKGLAYARTDIGGAYRWDSRKNRWIPLLDWLTKPDWNLYGIESLAIDPSDPGRLYLACGTYTSRAGGNGAILSSRDRGQSFDRCDLPFKFGGNEDGRSMGERLAVDPCDGRKLYFGTRNNGLWSSEDRGLHWSQVQSFPVKARTNGFGVTSVVFDSRNFRSGSPTRSIFVGVASHEQNLYHSVDAGATWQSVDSSPKGLFVHHLATSRNGKLFATFSNASGPNNITDGAVCRLDIDSHVWTDITPAKPNSGSEKSFGYAGLSIDPKDGATVAVSTLDRWSPGDDVFYSTDSGSTWSGLAKLSRRDPSAAPYMTWGAKTPKFGWWIGAVALDPFKTTRVLYGTGANIWGCDDVLQNNVGLPTRWTIRGEGIEETADIDLLSPSKGPHLISALGDIGGFTHVDLDHRPEGMSLHPMLNNTDSLASSATGVIVKVGRPNSGEVPGGISDDDGISWTPFASRPPGRATGGSIAISSDGAIIVWSPSGSAPYWSTDEGGTWTPCQSVTRPLQLIADSKSSNVFYGLSRTGDLYISDDGAKSFRRTSAPAIKGDHGSMRAGPDSPGMLFVPWKSGLLVSTDGGQSFSNWPHIDSADSVGFGKPRPGMHSSTLFLNGAVNGVFGVFRSDDMGLNWTRITDSAHEYGTRGVVIGDPRIYGRVYLGTNGRGVLYGDPIRTKASY